MSCLSASWNLTLLETCGPSVSHPSMFVNILLGCFGAALVGFLVDGADVEEADGFAG